MPAYSTPGVYVNETAISSLTPSLSGGTAAVFFGEAERGPTTPTLITDWPSYKRVFGELSDAYDLGYAVYHFFSNGGRACYVNRIAAAAATVAAKSSFPYYPTGSGNASGPMFNVTAASKGTWGNSLTVNVIAHYTEGGSASAGLIPTTDDAFGTFTLAVSLSGVEVERWPAVSLDPNNNRYVATVVNTYSNYIEIDTVTTVDPDADLEYVTTAQALGGGTDGTVAASDYIAAVDNVDVLNGNLILNAVGQDATTVIDALTLKAATRGDSFVIIDPQMSATDLTMTKADVAVYANATNGGYAAAYAPVLVMVDPAKTGPGAVRNTYPGGAVAGVIVRTEVQRSVAKAPAGFNADIRGALGTLYRLSDSDIGELYDNNPYVNSFKSVPGAGVVVYGARTLATTTSDKFIPVRRTLNYLKSSLKDITQFAVFEPNDANLWNRITAVVSGFLGEFYRSGGLKGANSAQAFYVVCNGSNNTAASVDQGIVNVEVGVALQYPAEFIVINLSQWTGGSNSVETL